MHPDPGQPGQAAGREQHAGRDQELRPGAREQHDVGQVRERDNARDHREKGEAGGDRGVPQGLLQVVGQEQKDPEQADAGDENGQVGGGTVAIQDDPQRQQRMRGAGLPPGERGEASDACGEEPPGRRGAPAAVAGVGEAVDDAEYPAAGRPPSASRSNSGSQLLLAN
jgi:hypothetical protein